MRWRLLLFTILTVIELNTTAQAVTFDWANVGDPGNAPDTRYDTTGYGSVGYSYNISKHEVTNAQYIEFLNAVDPTGTNANLGGSDGFLYNPSMAEFGVENTGTVDGARYVARAGREQNPVNYISFFDAMRFTNWLHNGQGAGGTENGAYTIGSGTDEVRSANAKYWIPSEDEWYKAAYYDPNGGVYYDYPTGTDTVPYSDNPGSLNTPDDTNVANFFKDDSTANGYDDGYAVSGSTSLASSSNPFTDVGAYTLAASPYGTFDQGGNVFEWNEAVISNSTRGFRGGSFLSVDGPSLRADSRYGIFVPSVTNAITGFRVATVPEPSTYVLVLSLLGLAFRGRL